MPLDKANLQLVSLITQGKQIMQKMWNRSGLEVALAVHRNAVASGSSVQKLYKPFSLD